MSRLTSEFWVQAYLLRLRGHEIPAYVTSKGDVTAGAVLVKMNTLDGKAELFQRSFDLLTGERAWVSLAQGPETAVDQAAQKQSQFDPDLWVIEVEDKQGRHLLDEPGLAD